MGVWGTDLFVEAIVHRAISDRTVVFQHEPLPTSWSAMVDIVAVR
jgi:hypothetical protein